MSTTSRSTTTTKTGMVCVSHSPIIMIRAKAPEEEPEILGHYQQCVDAISAFDPEQVILFGADHFIGFPLACMPAHCVGLACEALNDVGGFPGPLQVPAGAASNLVAYLRSDDIDTAISYKMRVDHGFSQPLKRLTGALDRYPTVPVFIGALTPPYLPFRRSRMLGESVGRFVRESGRRTLFIGSGGLSHHPTRYYPLVGAGEDKVATYQLEGERGGSFTDEQWLSRLHGMHLEGAEMLVNGQRTRQDIRLNPEMDRRFLEQIQGDDLEAFDGWDPAAIVETAGIGFLELHAWIAAMAAYRAAGGSAPFAQTYVPALEYGIGYGMLSAGLGEHHGQ